MADAGANLAANLKRLREARGLSQRAIAQLSGIPRPTWGSLEAGSANPTLSVLARAAAALQVSIEEPIGEKRCTGSHSAAPAVCGVVHRERGAQQWPTLAAT